MTAMPYTLTQVRVLRAPCERVWRALTEPAAIAKWNPPDGFVAEVHELDLREGGRFRISFVNLGNGQRNTFSGSYSQVVPNQKLVATSRFENVDFPQEITLTYMLRAVSVGTELAVEQVGLPDAIPAEACRLGWQQSFDLLTRLVEPEILP
ncbi:MAG TPA: SRPBCC domain-containing protein [Gemmatimonadaceae bacterium]|nr:SRPBCC domain-containing protein [Gemmatimonadaceae bacterium]